MFYRNDDVFACSYCYYLSTMIFLILNHNFCCRFFHWWHRLQIVYGLYPMQENRSARHRCRCPSHVIWANGIHLVPLVFSTNCPNPRDGTLRRVPVLPSDSRAPNVSFRCSHRWWCVRYIDLAIVWWVQRNGRKMFVSINEKFCSLPFYRSVSSPPQRSSDWWTNWCQNLVPWFDCASQSMWPKQISVYSSNMVAGDPESQPRCVHKRR